MWRQYMKKYVRIKKEVQERIDAMYHEIIADNDKVCGVLVRGSDYTTLKPKDHPVQPMLAEVIEKVRAVVEEQNCNKIYISTEEQKTIDAFKEAYGDKVVYVDKTYLNYQGGLLADANLENRKQSGLDYLTQIVILSKCDCIIAGICSGTLGAALLSNGFEYEYYWDLGYY